MPVPVSLLVKLIAGSPVALGTCTDNKLVPSKVRFASPSNVLAVPEPVITLLSALLLIVVPAGMLIDSKAGGDQAPVDVNT